MTPTLELGFPFSASYDSPDGPGIEAHNYVFRLATAPLRRPDEKKLRAKIMEGLISRVASRDLGLHVDFLKGKTLTEENILAEFRAIAAKLVEPHPLYRVSLERADGTRLTLDGR